MALLERGEELAAVAKLGSAGGVLLIEGGAGIGKTALVEAACASARAQGSEVLRAQGAELEAVFAFGVVRQLFERRLLGSSHAERKQLLAGPAGAAWTLLGTSTPIGPSDASFAIVHGLYWLVTNLAAARPLLVAVDDAHWADRASLQWLGYLAPRADGPGLWVLVALRPAEPGADPTALLAVAGTPRPSCGLGCSASKRWRAWLVEALGERVDDELSSRLRDATGGNPFYLRELLRATAGAATDGGVDWQAVTSEGARDVLRHLGVRLRRLGPAAMRLARAVAVLGDGCALRQAAALAGQSPDEALRAASALVDGEVFADAAPPRVPASDPAGRGRGVGKSELSGRSCTGRRRPRWTPRGHRPAASPPTYGSCRRPMTAGCAGGCARRPRPRSPRDRRMRRRSCSAAHSANRRRRTNAWPCSGTWLGRR